MSVSRFSRQSVQAGFPKQQSIWDGITQSAGVDALSSIVLPSAQTSLNFNNIPQTYTHLQLRGFVQETRSTYGISEITLQFNGDTGNNYSYHGIVGMGDTAAQPIVTYPAVASTSSMALANGSLGSNTGGTFGIIIIDILDYTNTNKTKTARAFSGVDFNGDINNYGGRVALMGGFWNSTSAITSITLGPSGGTDFRQYTSFALYGVK